MRFIALSTELLAYLQIVNKVIPTKSIIPLVENFLMELSPEGLKVTATDLETTLTVNIELENIEGEGKIAVGAKRLLEILKELPQQPLTFEINEDKKEVVIKSETGKYSIPFFSEIEEFPEPPQISPDEATSVVINSEILNKGINHTIFTVGEDELRPFVNGIFMEFKPEHMTFVATDSHKLMVYRRKDIKSEKEASFILAKKPAELIRNMIGKYDEDVNIEFDNRNAVFSMPGFKLVCRLIDAKYIDYESILPKQNDKTVEIDRQKLMNTTRRVSVFSNQVSRLVKYYFHENIAEITAQDIDFSISAYEQLNCRYTDEPITIGFKSTFLVEILQNLESEEITMTMLKPESPVLISPTFNEDKNEEIEAMLMPIVIDN